MNAKQDVIDFLNKSVRRDAGIVQDAGYALAVHSLAESPKERSNALRIAQQKLDQVGRLVAYDPIFDGYRHAAFSKALMECVQSYVDAVGVIGIAEELDYAEGDPCEGEEGDDVDGANF